MAGKKNQHYVSQLYLRNFGHGESRKLISLYNLRTGLYRPHAPIKTQASEDYFYDRGEGVETALGKMEDKVAPLIREMIRTEEPPKWRSAEHVAVLKYVVFQQSRTPLAKEEVEEHSNQHRETIERLWPGKFTGLAEAEMGSRETMQMLLRIAETNYHAAFDLRWKILRARGANPFITSDHPVARYNQLYEHSSPIMSSTGLNCRGLQLFFPLSPKHLLVVFDSDVYKVGGRNFRVTCVDAAEADVEILNVLQVVNAGEHLYFSEEVTQQHIEALVQKAARYMKKEKMTMRTGPAVIDGSEYGMIIHGSRVDTRMGLDLSCIKVSPSARKYRSSFEPQVRYRNLALLELITGFTKEVLSGRYTEEQFEEYRRMREQEDYQSRGHI